MRSAKGDSAGAIRDAERALAAGRALEDPQALFFVLAGCTHVFVLESESDRAIALAREFLDALGRGVGLQFAVINLPAFVSALVTLDLVPGARWCARRAARDPVDGGSARLCAGRFRGRRRDPAPNGLEAGGSRSPRFAPQSNSSPRAAPRRRTSSSSRRSRSIGRSTQRASCASARRCSQPRPRVSPPLSLESLRASLHRPVHNGGRPRRRFGSARGGRRASRTPRRSPDRLPRRPRPPRGGRRGQARSA